MKKTKKINKFKKLEESVEDLKSKLFKPKKKESDTNTNSGSWLSAFYGGSLSWTPSSHEERLDNFEKKLDLVIEYLGIERKTETS